MDEKSLKILEYDKIINQLKNMCESELAKDMAEELIPLQNLHEARHAIDRTDMALQSIYKKGVPPLFGIRDMKIYSMRLEKGAYLLPIQLTHVSDILREARAFKEYYSIAQEDGKIDYIGELSGSLYTNTSVENTINTAIIGEDEISDSASSNLRRIRKEIQSTKDSIQKKLQSLVSDDISKKYLQESIVTVRDGRYVVPVKSSDRGKFKGIIHDTSSSGATVFIEPIAIVEANNQIRELEIEEQKEIEKILKEISISIFDFREELVSNQEILTELDFLFAKAKLARRMNATKPALNDSGYTNLKKARHPLLETDKVVPIDIYLGDEFTSLIITGPNTGGKTVSLKTFGLLTLMAQSGLMIPVNENSEVSVYDNVFADIGDEQSIEQSLSTFSSHMINIVRILKSVNNNSVVLFDELGAGTDPTEGAALAMAILDNMLSNGTRVIATTHYNQLKIYALTTDGVKNASMEFDIETLSPTYKLLIGLPGKSNAFEISRRLGLDEYIIDYAKDLVSRESVEFENVLKSVEEDKKKTEEYLNEVEKLKEEQVQLKRKLDEEINKIERQKYRIIDEANKQALEIIKSTKEEASLIMDEIKSVKIIIDKENASKLQQANEELTKSFNKLSVDSSKSMRQVVKEPPKNLKIGETVEIAGMGQIGTVISEPTDDKQVEVQVGMMKIKLAVERLIRVDAKIESQSKTKKIIDMKSRSISSEIDLRGSDIEEGRYKVSKYIDDAIIAGLKEVRIIHGKGTGQLREGIRTFLKNNKHVKSFRTGGFNEGGTGVTIAELK